MSEGVEAVGQGGEGRLKALAARMERETKPPPLCRNCGEHEPDGVVLSPAKGRDGAPKLAWFCGWCREALEYTAMERERLAAERAAELKRKNKRRTRGRTSAGKHGAQIMGLAYRLGGFTARQLGELLLLESPERFEVRRAKAELEVELERLGADEERASAAEVERVGQAAAYASAKQAAADALSLLRHNKLMRSTGVMRKHAVGERTGRLEEYYHLEEGEGVLWGASRNGVVDQEEAIVAYNRHQLPRRAEHSAYRNDVYIRMLKDFALRQREAAPGAEVDEAGVVLSELGDVNGESWQGFPHQVGRFQPNLRKAKPRRGRDYEWLYPDGHPTFRWADGLECAFDVEAERESWGPEGAAKVDRYGAYWLRVYRELEDEVHAPELRPLREKEAEILQRRALLKAARDDRDEDWDVRKQASAELADEDSPVSDARLDEVRAQIKKVRSSPSPFLGLPEEVSPVLFIHQTEVWSRGVREAIRDREYPTPRYDAFVEHLVRAWDLKRLALNEERRKRGEREIPYEMFAERARREVDGLFIFTSFEQLREGGATTRAIWKPLFEWREEKATTLRLTAKLRARLSQTR